MSDLTKRQHFVPQFYIKLWNNGRDQITCHDLKEDKNFETGSDNVLLRKWFYELVPDSPDNKIEKKLAEAEGNYAKTFNKLNSLDLEAIRGSKEKQVINGVKSALRSDSSLETLKDFCALQYVRIPGAIEQKEFELQTSELTEGQKEGGLMPGYFVSSGYAYVVEKFRRMNIIALISSGQDYVTSDWPCFDLKDAKYAPLLGEEIGNNPDVVAYFPVTPRLALLMYHPNYNTKLGTNRVPNLIVRIAPDPEVRNSNTLVIQQADRFVITKKSSSFVEKVASKRKKRNAV